MAILLILMVLMLTIHFINYKTKITEQTDSNGRIDNVEIMTPLKMLK